MSDDVATLRAAAYWMRAEQSRFHFAVAELMEVIAEHVASHDCEAHCEIDGCPQVRVALALAVTYLGEPA